MIFSDIQGPNTLLALSIYGLIQIKGYKGTTFKDRCLEILLTNCVASNKNYFFIFLYYKILLIFSNTC